MARWLVREGCAVVICGRDGQTVERAVRRLERDGLTRDGSRSGQ